MHCPEQKKVKRHQYRGEQEFVLIFPFNTQFCRSAAVEVFNTTNCQNSDSLPHRPDGWMDGWMDGGRSLGSCRSLGRSLTPCRLLMTHVKILFVFVSVLPTDQPAPIINCRPTRRHSFFLQLIACSFEYVGLNSMYSCCSKTGP